MSKLGNISGKEAVKAFSKAGRRTIVEREVQFADDASTNRVCMSGCRCDTLRKPRMIAADMEPRGDTLPRWKDAHHQASFRVTPSGRLYKLPPVATNIN
jgi:hypothetical protein